MVQTGIGIASELHRTAVLLGIGTAGIRTVGARTAGIAKITGIGTAKTAGIGTAGIGNTEIGTARIGTTGTAIEKSWNRQCLIHYLIDEPDRIQTNNPVFMI